MGSESGVRTGFERHGLRHLSSFVPLNFGIRHFDPENGCGGKMPVTMSEWNRVGIRGVKCYSPANSDQKAYVLMKFLYRELERNTLHENCMDIIAPGTLFHVGTKTLHLAATNMTDGTSTNTD